MKRKLYLVLIFTIALRLITTGQDTTHKRLQYRMGIGIIGIGGGYIPTEYSDKNGIAGSLEFAIQKKQLLYSIGVTSVGEFKTISTSNVSQSVAGINVMIGKKMLDTRIFTALKTGLSMVIFTYRGDLISVTPGIFGYATYQRLNKVTIGFPLEVQALYVGGKKYGIGVSLFGNINTVNSFYGITLYQQFGRLKG